MAGRDSAAHALDADRVEPGERDCEAVPELLLELRQHALDGQHQDAPAPTAGDQLTDEDARLQGLPQPYGVSDENALARLAERLPGRLELVCRRVHRRAVRYVDALVVRDRLPKLALQVQPAVREAGRAVRHQPGLGGIEHLDVGLERGEEVRLPFPDQLRDPVAYELVPAVRRAVDAADHPLRVPDHDAGAGREDGAAGVERPAAGRTALDQGLRARASFHNRTVNRSSPSTRSGSVPLWSRIPRTILRGTPKPMCSR